MGVRTHPTGLACRSQSSSYITCLNRVNRDTGGPEVGELIRPSSVSSHALSHRRTGRDGRWIRPGLWDTLAPEGEDDVVTHTTHSERSGVRLNPVVAPRRPRGVWIAAIAALALLQLGAMGCAKRPPEPFPSTRVFVITIDTLRADHLGAYGYPRGVSPFLDHLAERSIIFDTAISASSHTGPSHASLFTSLYPAQHRLLQNGERLSDDLQTLAEVFRDAGYQTAGFTAVEFLEGLDQGFDQFRTGKVFSPADEVLGWAEDWLGELGPEQKVFVWIHLFDVHEWYHDHHLDRDAVDVVTNSARPGGDELVAFLNRAHGLETERFPGRQDVVEVMNKYDGQLLSTDRALERFFSDVAGSGPAQDGLWIVTADHGEGLGNHGFLSHGRYIYNEQLHVPLLIHAPGRSHTATRIKQLVRLVDLAPTLAEIAGVSFAGRPIPIEGRSLLPLLQGASRRWTSVPAFSQRRPADKKRLAEHWYPGEVFATQDGRRKLIVGTGGKVELYDLRNDPFELHNEWRAGDADQDEQIKNLVEQYNMMMEQGEMIGSGVISPEHIEELKALGYL